MPDDELQSASIGDAVQCEPQGVARFQEPRRVTGLDGEWAFIEGSQTGVLLAELVVIQRAASIPKGSTVNTTLDQPPIKTPPLAPPATNGAATRDLTFPLIGGAMAVLRTPVPMTEENYVLLTTLLAAMKPAIVAAKPS